MVERIILIETPPEDLVQHAHFLTECPAVAKVVEVSDSKSVAKALLEEGLMETGDNLTITFVAGENIPQDSVSRRAKIYNARKTSEGKIVAITLENEGMLDITFDRNN